MSRGGGPFFGSVVTIMRVLCTVSHKLWIRAKEDLAISSTHGMTSLGVSLHTVTPSFEAIHRSRELD